MPPPGQGKEQRSIHHLPGTHLATCDFFLVAVSIPALQMRQSCQAWKIHLLHVYKRLLVSCSIKLEGVLTLTICPKNDSWQTSAGTDKTRWWWNMTTADKVNDIPKPFQGLFRNTQDVGSAIKVFISDCVNLMADEGVWPASPSAIRRIPLRGIESLCHSSQQGLCPLLKLLSQTVSFLGLSLTARSRNTSGLKHGLIGKFMQWNQVL